MKVLTPWMCILAAALQPAFATQQYEAYRLGDYNQASQNLVQVQDKDKDGVAEYYLGRIYLYGYGQLKNDNQAMRYFEKSASKGYLPAQLLMGRYALLKENNPTDAFIWFKKAAASGDLSAKMYVAAAYLFGVGVKQNSDIARQFYIEAAKNGDPIAQYALARHFLSSRQASNKKLGLIWLNKSASAGNPRAQTRLAELYFQGQLVAKEPNTAKDLLLKAAQQQFVPAYVELGNIAVASQAWQDALFWFQKAAASGSLKAQYAEAELYLTESNPLYNKTNGFMSILKLAQNGYAPAQKKLADLYKQGIGTEQNVELASQWEAKAKLTGTEAKKGDIAKLANWLSNGFAQGMENTNYRLGGIFSAWHNVNALKDNIYNPAPMRVTLGKEAIFKPDFSVIRPNELSVSDYYDALVNGVAERNTDKTWSYPAYPLNPQIEALQKEEQPVLIQDTKESDPKLSSTVAAIQPEPKEKNKYAPIINRLFQRAVMGDSEAQFDLGQVYEYGIGLPKNNEQAIIWYQNAAEQQHSGAEYSLGALYLKTGSPQDYKIGKNLLMVAAFKGNSNAQYVLSKILNQPVDGVVSPFDHDQALSMQYLASANGHGLAQYDLAEYLARNKGDDLSLSVQKQRTQRIRALYASAAEKGVQQAILPLAFYNAMETDKHLQQQAFSVAQAEASKGNGKAALLTGLLYDRGIGVTQDHAKAMEWYQKADAGPVSDFIVGTYFSENPGDHRSSGRDMLRRAAHEEFPPAYFNLAVLDKQDSQEFLEDLQKAYSLGNSKAGILLADYYLASNESDQKMQDAKNIYTGLAQKGDASAQLKLAYMLEKGLGSAPDYAQAEQWYLRSAAQDNAIAQFLSGEFYQTGFLGKPDYQQALIWYKQAATKLSIASVAAGFLYETVFDDYGNARKAYEQAALNNDVTGEYDLALMLENGKGFPEDLAKAGELYDKAAQQGFSPAMTQLANMYFSGSGKEKNQNQALYWYKKAAEQGNDIALYQLGLISETGVGGNVQASDALLYYKNSANKGNEKAMLALARMYDNGFGVRKNPDEAHRFYETLAGHNNGYAQYQLARQHLAENDWSRVSPEGITLLTKARENGNYQAGIILQRLAAQTQDKISYLEPVNLHDWSSATAPSAELMYMQALNAWNHGDEVVSYGLLKKLIAAYPDYEPAKKAFEAMKKKVADSSLKNRLG